MEAITLWEALALWVKGAPLDGHAIGDVPVYILGRLGAALSLAGGLVVVLDFAGSENLRRWGQALRTQPIKRFFARLADSWVATSLLVLGVVMFLNFAEGVQATIQTYLANMLRPLHDLLGGPLGWVLIGTAVALLASAGPTYRSGRPGSAKALLWSASILMLGRILPYAVIAGTNLVGFVLAMLVLFLGFVALGILIDLVAVMLDLLLVRPFAWALDREQPGQPIRWAGFGTLLLGQLLELIAA